MMTDIEQRVHVAIGPATDDHRLGAEINQEIIAAVRQAADMPGTEPVTQQHALEIPLKNCGIRIARARQ